MTRKKDEHKKNEKVFEDDEMALRAVNSNWTENDLLDQDGVFFLKDVVKILELDPVKIKKKAREIEANGQVTWDVMGARKIWNHWIVRMKVFGPYYRNVFVSCIRSIPEDWDGNTLLEQKGLYYLVDVCKHIPFTTHQLRYQAKRNPNARAEYGIWKDEELNAFIVDMERLAPWIIKLWEGGFGHKE